LEIGSGISMGSLADGTGPLRVRSPSTLIVWGRVFLRVYGAVQLSPYCYLNVDGVPQERPAYGNFKDVTGASVAISASLEVAPGTHMVSMDCFDGGEAGLVQVNVLAVPH
ncbi:MAG: hypothetical protein WCS84_09680, partial [Nocardioides sp.]